MRRRRTVLGAEGGPRFPFLFGGTFIEAKNDSAPFAKGSGHFPSFSEGLSLRPFWTLFPPAMKRHFPSFSEGLSLRRERGHGDENHARDFPSFSEGLSLRPTASTRTAAQSAHFPSFSEGLSLRRCKYCARTTPPLFPFLFGGTFIEACDPAGKATGYYNFPSFSEGLSLRLLVCSRRGCSDLNFPSFSEGLSLRLP